MAVWMMRRILKMRSFRSMRFLWAVGGTILLLGLVLPTQALAQLYEYTVTATINKITAQDPNSVPDLTAAGIAIGSKITSTIILPLTTRDILPALDRAGYPSPNISYSVGDGPVTFDVSGMTRDNAMGIGNDLPPDATVPVPYDGFGWAGAEPTSTSGPSFLALDNWDEVLDEGKGTATYMVSFNTATLPDTSIPTEINLNDWFVKIVLMDLLDTSRGDATIALEAPIDTITIKNVSVPTMDGWAVAVLLLGMLAAGSVLATRQIKVKS